VLDEPLEQTLVALPVTRTRSFAFRRTPETQTPHRPELGTVNLAVRVWPAARTVTVNRLRHPLETCPRTRTREPLRETDEILSFTARRASVPEPGVGVGFAPGPGVPGVDVGVDGGAVGVTTVTGCADEPEALPAASYARPVIWCTPADRPLDASRTATVLPGASHGRILVKSHVLELDATTWPSTRSSSREIPV
jgi:hypothetical protein